MTADQYNNDLHSKMFPSKPNPHHRPQHPHENSDNLEALEIIFTTLIACVLQAAMDMRTAAKNGQSLAQDFKAM